MSFTDLIVIINYYFGEHMKKYNCFIGIDPGVMGGIAIFDKDGVLNLYRMPVQSVIKNKKKKKIYDIQKIVEILKKYNGDEVLFIQELVGVRMGEGTVSAFSFGRSSGITLGVAHALGFDVVEVSPVKWKKTYPELSTEENEDRREIIRDLRKKSKTLKDKSLKKENSKQIEKLNRAVKSEAKQAAIDMVRKLYPMYENILKYKNSDGVAESVLIAQYGRENQNELVQNS